MSEPMPNRNKPPCKGCADRCYGCHDHCQKPEYLAWKAQQETVRKNREAYNKSVWIEAEVDKSRYRKHKRYK